MADTALVFLDTETTGLEFDDDVWEFGAIRREPDGTQTEHHYFVEHDPAKCKHLPEPFFTDHHVRFPALHDGSWGDGVISRTRLASILTGDLMDGRPHVVGTVPAFDMERMLARLVASEWKLKATDLPWHYHLADAENIAAGYLVASANALFSNSDGDDNLIRRAVELREIATPPWDSGELSRAVTVNPDDFERHTALGDARWGMAIWDAIYGSDS